MGSCAFPSASHLHFGGFPYRKCPCRLHHPRLVRRIIPTLLRSSFLKCHVSCTGGSSSAFDQFFLNDFGLHSPLRVRLSASSQQRFQLGLTFDTADIPLCCNPPVCSPFWPFSTLLVADKGFYIQACYWFVTSSIVGYATRLTDRLPGLDFHQLEEQPLSAAPAVVRLTAP